MIVSFFLKFPCFGYIPGYIWNHSLSPNSKFQNRTIFLIKLDNFFSNFRFLLSWRNLSGNFTVFWNNRQLIGSCLYSLVLAEDLFLRRLSPLVKIRPTLREDLKSSDESQLIWYRWSIWWKFVWHEKFVIMKSSIFITIDICLIVWRQLPEDEIAFSLISREEAKSQFSTGRVSQASAPVFVTSVWPPTPSCCRGG